MLNLFTTPEGKDFIFLIPENVKIDVNGFYIIDDSFKEANQHQAENWQYLAHDLEYRGLAASNSFLDRVDYMDKKRIKYEDYYLQFIKLDSFLPAIQRHIGLNKLLASKDEHFNDIPMSLWDMFPSRNYIDKRYKYAEAANYVGRDDLWKRKAVLWSPSTNVSFAKISARIVKEKALAASNGAAIIQSF